jgi:hypothetical protein
MLEKTASRMRSVAGRTCFARPVEMGMPLATPPVMRMIVQDVPIIPAGKRGEFYF